MFGTQLQFDNGEKFLATGAYGETFRVVADPPVVVLDDLTHRERSALENELALAAQIQRELLPRRAFSKTGWETAYHYEPAGLLSGDYCDLLETRKGFLFLLGDVSGKGVAASMRMTQLHGTFRSLAEADPSLDAMTEAANRMFSIGGLSGHFATLVVGRAEHDGSIEFVSAGHPPFLHLSKGRAHAKCATSIPLGILPATRFPLRRFWLDKGDSLFLFTDGLTESVNPEGEQYGLGRVEHLAVRCASAMPSQLISECLSDHLQFTRGVARSDDLSLLVMRRTA
jgi:phosphoserine phosphatase RsbU/P